MKRRILLIVLFLAVAGGLGWLLVALHPGEPVYQGRPLSVSLGGYAPLGMASYATPGTGAGMSITWEQADAAMNDAGGRAVPTLLRFLRARDSGVKIKLLELAQKQHFIPIHHTPAASLNFEAAMGFRRLGTNAGGAVPALVKIYARHISDSSRTATVMALDDVGAGGIPLLAEAMGSRDEEVREMLTGVLGRIQGRSAAVVPVLAGCLGDTSASVRATAAAMLAHFGPDAAGAVPTLRKARQDANEQVRHAADYALERIEPQMGGK